MKIARGPLIVVIAQIPFSKSIVKSLKHDPGCFRVHHEAADRHICLQFLGSVFVQMSWTQSNDTLRFIAYFQLRPQFVHSGGVLL